VVEEVEKPSEFECLEILNILDTFYTPEQLQIAQFISQYYFSSLGEAIALFLPYRKNLTPSKPLFEGKKPTLSKMQHGGTVKF
jgi:primosomal protein N' (replication factor Y)